jgi:hypothetical protein
MAIRHILIAAVAAAFLYSGAAAAQTKIMVYKSPWCGCCGSYIAHLKENGFDVTVRKVEDMGNVKRMMRVPEAMESCHTAVVGGYIVEGHVPIAAIERLMAEKPDIIGISLPGMPLGSPGMNGEKAAPFQIYAITKDGPKLFMEY